MALFLQAVANIALRERV